jgi:hypothetical protein
LDVGGAFAGGKLAPLVERNGTGTVGHVREDSLREAAKFVCGGLGPAFPFRAFAQLSVLEGAAGLWVNDRVGSFEGRIQWVELEESAGSSIGAVGSGCDAIGARVMRVLAPGRWCDWRCGGGCCGGCEGFGFGAARFGIIAGAVAIGSGGRDWCLEWCWSKDRHPRKWDCRVSICRDHHGVGGDHLCWLNTVQTTFVAFFVSRTWLVTYVLG